MTYETATATCNVNYWVMPIKAINEVTAQGIINATCIAFDVTKHDLISTKRKRHLVKARFICMYVIKKRLGISLNAIAGFFNRDHTSVLHAIRQITNDLTVPAYRHETNELIMSVIKYL